jgi:hypothetical protein
VHATETGSAAHAAEAAAAVHAAKAATAVHATPAAEATATAASAESRRCESKGGDRHTRNQTITRPVVHPIPPLLSTQSPRRNEINRPNSCDKFK